MNDRPTWEQIVKSADPLIPQIVETYRPPLSLDEPCPVCGVKRLNCNGHYEQD